MQVLKSNFLRHREWGQALLIMLILLSGLPFALSLLSRLDRIAPSDNKDWMQVYFHQAAARRAVLIEQELDYLCPYINGGYPLLGHPYDPTLSPTFISTLIFGATTAPRINSCFYYLGGIIGIILLTAKILRYHSTGILFASILYAVSGWFPARLFGGNYNESTYYLFPLILFCFLHTLNNRRWLFPFCWLLYLTLAESKFVFPITLLMLFAVLLFGKHLMASLLERPQVFKGMKILLFAAGITCCLGAAKLSLLLNLLNLNPRLVEYPVYQNSPMNLSALIVYVWSRFFAIGNITPELLTVKDNIYLGCGGLPLLFSVLILVAAPRRYGLMFILLIIGFFITLGNLTKCDLFQPLSMLPVFNAIEYPWKYFSYFILFFICLLSGGFFHEVFRREPRTIVNILFLLLMLAALYMPWRENIKIIPQIFTAEPPRLSQAGSFFQVDRAVLYENLLQEIGVLKIDGLPIPTRVKPKYIHFDTPGKRSAFPGYRGEVYFLNGAGKIEKVKFSFNHVNLKIDLPTSDTLVINMNYNPAWHSTDANVIEYQGLLALTFSGSYAGDLQVVYRPRFFYFWLMVSMLSFIGLLLLSFSKRGGRFMTYII